MRWFTLVLPVTLFYSLSFVNAIPHDVDEMRHWLHRRQDSTGSSTVSNPVVPSQSRDPQGVSSPAVSPTSQLIQSSSLASSLSSSIPSSSPTPQQSSDLPSPSDSSSSGTVSSSPSSSPPSTSTRSRTSSTSPSTITNTPGTQVSTSNRRFSSTVSIPSSTLSADGNAGTGTGSGTSFLKNKAAMGSTFAIVGLVGAAIIVGAVFFLIKKIRQRKDQEDFDTYFEKIPANHSNNANNRDIGGGNDYGLGPSATDLTSPASHQAYMPRDVHYGSTGQYPNQFANYNGLEYPPDRGSVVEPPVSYAPGTAFAAAMSQRGQYRYEGQVEDPNAVPNHPFADPDNRRY